MIGLVGCHKSLPTPEGTPLSQVLLRYSPDVEQTYRYQVSMSLDKEILVAGKRLKEGKEKGRLDFSLTAIEKNRDGYRTKFEARWGRSTFSKQVADEMSDKARTVQSKETTISDRYVWDKGGTHNLCFPDQPVSPGAEWTGAVQFFFGDLATVEAPTLPVRYRLAKAVRSDDGRFAVIECVPLTNRVVVPLQFGQLGLKCDSTGEVTAVRQDSDAQGKIDIGDVLTAVNGHAAKTAKDWHVLYERFIEPPTDVGSNVRLTVKKNGQENQVDVGKTFATVGVMEVTLSEATRRVVFDIDRGIIVSDVSAPQYSVTYHLRGEFPFVDTYAGTGSFQGQAGTTLGPRLYNNQYSITLQE